jgi:hypothetical protein
MESLGAFFFAARGAFFAAGFLAGAYGSQRGEGCLPRQRLTLAAFGAAAFFCVFFAWVVSTYPSDPLSSSWNPCEDSLSDMVESLLRGAAKAGIGS